MNVKNAIVQGENYRFTVLTPSMIRMEYSEKGVFVDKKTQMVVNRTFDVPEYTVNEKNGELIIETDKARLVYTGGKFAGNNLRVELKNQMVAFTSVWHYGDKGHNLKGTTRTLDEANGEIPLQDGLFSFEGWAVISDKGSMLLAEDGWIETRKDIEAEDLYFFGYGTDYLGCLKDYYKLTGATPILPKYALGNWWSRYYKYTEKSYLELMDRFEKEDLPFTVGVIDMDWHVTDVDPKYGTGRNTKGLLRYVDKRVANGEWEKYEKIWLVYDKDDFPEDNFDNTQFSAEGRKDNRIKVAWSNESFELWLLLHFQDYGADNGREDYIKKLNGYFEYSKTREDLFKVVTSLGSLQEAKRRAQIQYNNFMDQGITVPSKMIPATRVYEVVEELEKYLH